MRLADVGHAGVIRSRISHWLDIGTPWTARHAAAHRCAHDVVARHQAEDSVRAEIVGLRGSPGIDQLTFAVDELIAERLDLDVCDGVAELVGNAAGDRAAARQAEVDFVECLSVGDIERFAGLERSRLSVLERHVSGLVDEKAIPPGRQRREFVAPFAVGRDAPVELRLARVDVDLRAADRRARVGGDDAAADSSRSLSAPACCRAGACRRSGHPCRLGAGLVTAASRTWAGLLREGVGRDAATSKAADNSRNIEFIRSKHVNRKR